MLIKVYNGTVRHSAQSLCETCRNGTITRGQRLEDEIVRCEAQPMSHGSHQFQVWSVRHHLDARLPTYAQLLEQAWILKAPNGRRSAGFVRGSDLRDEEFRELMAELHDSSRARSDHFTNFHM